MRLALTWLPLRPLQDLTAYETATLSWEEGTAPYVVDIIPSGSSGSVVRRAGSFLSASAADPKTDRTLLPPPPCRPAGDPHQLDLGHEHRLVRRH